MPGISIPSRILDAFIEGFTRTFKEIVAHFLLGATTLIWVLLNRHFKETWDILVPLCWFICAEGIWHLVKAALTVNRNIPAVVTSSAIVSGTGEPIKYISRPIPFYQAKVWITTSVFVIICLAFAISIRVAANHFVESVPAVSLPPPPPPPQIEIFAQCEIIGLPLSIPAQTSIHLLGLNKEFMLSQHWGLFDIPNDTDKKVPWPSQQIMDLSKKKHNFGTFGYKCDVSNHSQVDVLDAAITMTFWYNGQKGDEIKYTPILSPLDAGSHFVFYVFNDCPVRVAGVLPSNIEVTANGIRRNVPLNLPHRNPVEPIMGFFPSQIQWVRQQPCAEPPPGVENKREKSSSTSQRQENSGGTNIQQQSSGNNSPNVSAPNGIAIGGGIVTNPVVNNFGPQLRFPEQRLDELTRSLAGWQGTVIISVENADSTTLEDATNLLTAFIKTKKWNTQGVNTSTHPPDVGADNLPVPIPKGIHIHAQAEQCQSAQFVSKALLKFGVTPIVEPDTSLDDCTLSIVVGASQ